MRKIDKSPNAPATLVNAPVPTSSAEVSDAIYKAEDVRKQLVTDQNYKCAYCECDLTIHYNDVEHYRPKSRYYWLGHKWENLLYACDLCNRTYKNDAFPLKHEDRKVTEPGSVAQEEPLLINPSQADPTNHIKFRRHEAVALSPEGTKTIEVFHLNDRNERYELVSGREQLYELFEIENHKKNVAQLALQKGEISQAVYDTIITLCNGTLNNLTSPSRAYSGMLIAQI